MSKDAYNAFHEAGNRRREGWERATDKRVERLTLLMVIHMTLAACITFGLFWWCADLQQQANDQHYTNEANKEFQREVRDGLRELKRLMEWSDDR